MALGQAADDPGAATGHRVEQVRRLSGGDEMSWIDAHAQRFVAAVLANRTGVEFAGDDKCETVGVLGAADPT